MNNQNIYIEFKYIRIYVYEIPDERDDNCTLSKNKGDGVYILLNKNKVPVCGNAWMDALANGKLRMLLLTSL